jgi:hypothetical protein
MGKLNKIINKNKYCRLTDNWKWSRDFGWKRPIGDVGQHILKPLISKIKFEIKIKKRKIQFKKM